jgi:hypothetical protein
MNDRNGEKAAANADKKGRTAQKRERKLQRAKISSFGLEISDFLFV